MRRRARFLGRCLALGFVAVAGCSARPVGECG